MRWDKPAAREHLALLQSLAFRVKVSELGLRTRTSDASQLEGEAQPSSEVKQGLDLSMGSRVSDSRVLVESRMAARYGGF